VPPLNWITLGQIKSDSIDRMIQLTDKTFYKKTKEKGNKQYYLGAFIINNGFFTIL